MSPGGRVSHQSDAFSESGCAQGLHLHNFLGGFCVVDSSTGASMLPRASDMSSFSAPPEEVCFSIGYGTSTISSPMHASHNVMSYFFTKLAGALITPLRYCCKFLSG